MYSYFFKYFKFLLIILVFGFIKHPFVFASIESSIEVPMLKPDEKYWRLRSKIEVPEKKPDPVIFMLALPSDLIPPQKKPDPKSIFPLATRSLTEMVFKKTNIVTKSENLITLRLRKNEGINPLLRRAGFNARQAYQASIEIENKINLNKLPIGLEVKILNPEKSKTGAFSFKMNDKFNLYAILDKNLNWTSFKAIRPVKQETLLISGKIKSNLYLSAQEVGLPEDTLIEFVQLMGYSVDFQRQIQEGDTYKILF